MDENSIIINSQYKDDRTGITHIYFKQSFKGSEVFNSQSSLHFDKKGNLFYTCLDFSGKMLKDEKPAIINADNALRIAIVNAGLTYSNLNKPILLDEKKSFKLSTSNISSEPLNGKFCYYSNGMELIPAWQIEILNDLSNDWFTIVVDASNGNIITKINYTIKENIEAVSESAKSYDYITLKEDKKIFKTAKGNYNVIALPNESPVKGGRNLILNPSKTNASPFGWHDTDGVDGADFTITRGNNVWAKEDTIGGDGNGYSPDGDSILTFDFPFNQTNSPRANLNAGLTNLFYMNNIMHDVMYNYGFTEVAGNFQTNNYDKGGTAKDGLYAEAQDGGVSGANISVPPDGLSPRMQVTLYRPNGIINNFRVNSPSVNTIYSSHISRFGPKPPIQGITGDLVWANDSSSNPTEACSPLKNQNEVKGKIVMIDRGVYLTAPDGCPYTQKILNAQKAGAIGVIFVSYFSTVTSGATGKDSGIQIPSILVSNITGYTLNNYMSVGKVNVTIYDSSNYGEILDACFDNGVIAHEYGHGISMRLTGGPDNTLCLSNAEQAGEGWSDFFALYMTAKPWETLIKGRGLGTYLRGQDSNGIGIRNYKYSRDKSINPATYKHVAQYQLPHGIGFVWCTMLYDLMLNMIDKYGYDTDLYNGTGGNNKTLQIIMLGLKLQKCYPGFVDSRNAIIAADSVLNGGKNYELIWKTFANRGLGFSATQGSEKSVTDQIEAFDLPSGLGVENKTESGHFMVYPNPNNGKFRIKTAGLGKISKIVIYDFTGKELNTKSDFDPSSEILFNARNLTKGFYILNIATDKGSFNSKIIIE